MSPGNIKQPIDEEVVTIGVDRGEFFVCCTNCCDAFSLMGKYRWEGERLLVELDGHSRVQLLDGVAYHYLPAGSPGSHTGRVCGRLGVYPTLCKAKPIPVL